MPTAPRNFQKSVKFVAKTQSIQTILTTTYESQMLRLNDSALVRPILGSKFVFI